MRQELEFDTEQELIEAGNAAFGYDEEIKGEMPQNLSKLDIHQIQNAALPIQEPESVVTDRSLQGHPGSNETPMQSLPNKEQHIGSHEYGKFHMNASIANMTDIIQALQQKSSHLIETLSVIICFWWLLTMQYILDHLMTVPCKILCWRTKVISWELYAYGSI